MRGDRRSLDRGEETNARVRRMIDLPERDATPREIADALSDEQRDAMTSGLLVTRYVTYASHVSLPAIAGLARDHCIAYYSAEHIAEPWHRSSGLWLLQLDERGITVAAVLAAER